MRKKRKKMGRPPKRESERMGEQFTVYLTKGELRTLAATAKRMGLTISALVMRPWREAHGPGKEQ